MTKGAAVAKKGRSKEGLNKAQLIRDALKKYGIDAAAKDVQAYTEAQGATVAPAQISNIRTKLKERASGRGRKAASASGAAVTADELIQARVMAEKVGGVDRALELLSVLQRIR